MHQGLKSVLWRLAPLLLPMISPEAGRALQVADHIAERVIASLVTRDGGLLIAELDGTVTYIDATGAATWTITSDSLSDPAQTGSLIMPSRLAHRHAEGFLVYDHGPKTVNYLSPTGFVERRWTTPFHFRIIDGILELPNGDVVIAGFAESRSRNSLHVFSPDGAFRLSLGPVPEVRQEWVLHFWGVGSIAFTQDGRLLFVRKLPYEVYEVDWQSQSLALVARHPQSSDRDPDDAFFRRIVDGTLEMGLTYAPVPKPSKLIPVRDGAVIVKAVGRATEYDYYRSGTWCSFQVDEGQLLGVGPQGDVWLAREQGEGVRISKVQLDWRSRCER